MTRDQREIDRLIEDGLTLYGQGDLDGALSAWQQVLELDPDNAQATSYVDYVQMNYELLSREAAGDEPSGPFAISDDGDAEYQIEILPGELELDADRPRPADPIGPGWYIDDESGRPHLPLPAPSLDRGAGGHGITVELEADEPPLPAHGGPGAPGAHDHSDPHDHNDAHEVSFDSATREYGAPPGKQAGFSEIEPVTTEYHHDAGGGFDTPQDAATPEFETKSSGFGSQVTDIRRRDLGFVRPVVPDDEVTPPPAERPTPRPVIAGAAALKMTLRTPNVDAFDHDAFDELDLDNMPTLRPDDDDDDGPSASSSAEIEVHYGEPHDDHHEEPPTKERRALSPVAVLVDAVPDPTPPVPPASGPVPADRAAGGSTRDLPGPTRGPSSGTDQPAIGAAPTLDLTSPGPERPPTGPQPALPAAPAAPAALLAPAALPAPAPPTALLAPSPLFAPAPATTPPTFEDKTNELPAPHRAPTRPMPQPTRPPDPVASAPTRDLGLRQQPRAGTEDEPTGQSDVRMFRAAAAAAAGRATPRAPEPTRNDVVLPFDPIDARSAQILEDVDDDAPAKEPREDRTRRRITRLFERAAAWSRDGELDRAVAAVDLALSEDPSSPLAQKLIHRNRDTMQAVFQAFLGDLQRQPQLARPLHELASAPISSRAAFLLSRIDGSLSLDEILDVSGMSRLEAYRYLCQLLLRGILR